ncbi:MAG: hypothetical protein ACRC7N_05815 [Clostridium sp.]
MKLITSIMLSLIDLVGIFLSVMYINDDLIQMGVVGVLLLLLIVFIYKVFKISIDEIEYAYVDFKKSYEEDKNLNDSRHKELMLTLKGNSESTLKILNESNVNIILLSKYVQENSKELNKLFESYFNQMKIEFANQNKLTIEGIKEVNQSFSNKIDDMDYSFGKNINLVKQKLNESLIESNGMLNQSITNNLDNLYKSTNEALKDFNLQLSSYEKTIISSFNDGIEGICNNVTRNINELINRFEEVSSNLNNTSLELYEKIHDNHRGLVEGITSNSTTLLNGLSLSSSELFSNINSNFRDLHEELNNNNCTLFESLNSNARDLYNNLNANLELLNGNINEITNINKDTLNNINTLGIGFSNFENDMKVSMEAFSLKEENLIVEITNCNNELHDIISKGLDTILSESSSYNEKSAIILTELKGVIVDMGALIDDSIVEMKNGIVEENSRNNRSLGSIFERQIKELNRRLLEGNRKWQEISEEIDKNNSVYINDVKRVCMDMNSLHRELLRALDDNQKKMLELNEEDIKLMREMII